MALATQTLITPAPDASTAEWTKFLTAKGYARASETKPIPNYKSFHGYWVPPRLGSAAKGSKRTSSGKTRRIDIKPYSAEALAKLLRSKPSVFEALPTTMKQARAIHADDVENGEKRRKRQALATTVAELIDSGLLTDAEATKKLATWDKLNGLS